MRLDDLHFVLQIAIGWQNCHPFEFRVGDKAWGLVDRDAESNPLPAESATLADVHALGHIFKYGYVFGEDWQHTVEIEAVAPAEPGVVYPRLIEAQGRCPPADIGGAAGYEVYVSAIADPRHPLHETMIEFDDPEFDPATGRCGGAGEQPGEPGAVYRTAEGGAGVAQAPRSSSSRHAAFPVSESRHAGKDLRRVKTCCTC